jgi:TfoX/Sxy family transcriptional regulator of competence genes
VKMPKATEEDKAWFRSLVPDAPGVEVKPMFGQLGAFVNGNMFAGLFAPQVGVKLDEDDRTELSALDGAGPFGPAERPMGGYVALPESMPEAEAAAWVARAHEYVASLPPKAKKGT